MSFPGLDFANAYSIAEWVIRIGSLIVVPFRRKFTAAAWLLLIFFLPLPGLLLFLAIGQPKFPRFRLEQYRGLRPFVQRVAKSLQQFAPKDRSPIAQFA